MSDKTGIEWTDATWNPIRGCTRVSEGCRNCYAERVAARFSGAGQPYEGLAEMTPAGPRWTGKVRFITEHLLDPLHWKKPRKIFVNSMSDLFHEGVPFEDVDRIFAVMALCPQHKFQILTKRPQRMRKYLVETEPVPFSDWYREKPRREFIHDALFLRLMRSPFEPRGSMKIPEHVQTIGQACAAPETWPLPNVWLGVSIEDQATADARIPELLKTPAAVRFISYEPALGPVDLRKYLLWPECKCDGEYAPCEHCNENGPREDIHWVICGGESGPDARPMHPAWVGSVRDQCVNADAKFFFKQWGEWKPALRSQFTIPKSDKLQWSWSNELLSIRVGKATAGREYDGRTWDEFPEEKR